MWAFDYITEYSSYHFRTPSTTRWSTLVTTAIKEDIGSRYFLRVSLFTYLFGLYNCCYTLLLFFQVCRFGIQ